MNNMEIITIPEDKQYEAKIQGWVDEVIKRDGYKFIKDLNSIWLLEDSLMTEKMRGIMPEHPHPETIMGMAWTDLIFLRNLLDDDDQGLWKNEIDPTRHTVIGTFFHEVGHQIARKKGSMMVDYYNTSGDYPLFRMWDRHVGKLANYSDRSYADDGLEIFARMYCYWMLVQLGKKELWIDEEVFLERAKKQMQEAFT